MTTTGEYLVSLSSLETGSALAHLLATKTGTGTGDSFYSGTVRVVTSRNELSVSRKAKRAAIEQDKPAPRASEPKKKATRINTSFVLDAQNTAYSFTQPEEVFVLVRRSTETVVQTAINSVVTQRKKT